MEYAVYETATGAILRFGDVALEEHAQLQITDPLAQSLIVGSSADDGTHYVVDGSFVPRPTFDVPEQITMVLGDEPVVVNLPVGTVISMGGVTIGTANDGLLNINAELDGEYELRLDLWPYLPGSIKVRVNAD